MGGLAEINVLKSCSKEEEKKRLPKEKRTGQGRKNRTLPEPIPDRRKKRENGL